MKESGTTYERESSIDSRFLSEDEKVQYKEATLALLGEYPDNFFTGLFEQAASQDFDKNKVVLSFNGNTPTGCLFYNPNTNECDFLAITKKILLDKSEVAKKLFQTIFDSVPKGTKVFWYINSEDAVFEGRPVGQNFARGRKLYTEMGATFTKIENKFGEGNHAYLVEVITT